MIDLATLHRVLEYSPETGIFIWKEKISQKVLVGNAAGTTNAILGYVIIALYGKQYYAHRLAYFYMTGKWPQNQIDHINGTRSDNKWLNLRAATSSQNKMNRGPLSTNKIGIKGVYQDKNSGKFIASISLNGKSKYLGSFAKPTAARAAYNEAAKRFFGEFARI